MLEAILAYLNNWFEVSTDRVSGTIEVRGGTVSLPSLSDYSYVRILGSKFSDGLHTLPLSGLTDERFEGTVTPVVIPKDLIGLCGEIEAWAEKNTPSIYASESFGGYTYSHTNYGGTAGDWMNAYGKRLRRWRKL